MLMQQQDMNGMQGQNMNQQRNFEELANLEEAFRYQEMELQKEREASNQLRVQMMKLHEQREKLKDKQDANKKRIKKINDLSTQSKRQAGLLEQKVRECGQLKQDMSVLQNKLGERERVHGQNRDLVTKNCAQQSTISRLKKEIQDLNNKMETMAADKSAQARNPVPPRRPLTSAQAGPTRPSPGLTSQKRTTAQAAAPHQPPRPRAPSNADLPARQSPPK